jgi:uncharacterized protein YwgA
MIGDIFPIKNVLKFFKLLKRGGKMNKREIILAALAPALREAYTPVQVQKLMFLIDAKIPDLVDGPHFHFQPYNYGPFDKSVYDEIENLQKQGDIEFIFEQTWRNYRLTKKGQELGEKILASLDPKAQNYIERASDFVRNLSFRQLVLAIYKAFPEMRENSVFQE